MKYSATKTAFLPFSLLTAALLTCFVISSPAADSRSYVSGNFLYGNFKADWDSRGDLEYAPTPNGPWTPVLNASYSGSVTQTVVNGARFFRVRDGFRPGEPLPFPTVKPLPRIQSATVQLLPQPTALGDTKLEVIFAPNQNVASSNLFILNEQPYSLRDDGVAPDDVANDGIQTAIVPFDTNDMIAWNNHVAQIPPQLRSEPVFSGRTIVGTNDLAMFNISNFLARIKIPLLPFPCSLGSSKFYDYRKTLIITDLSVVEDSTRTFDPCTGVGTRMGAWTFGSLMTNMANTPVSGISGPDFVRTWLRLWEVNQTVNSDIVTNRQFAIVSKVVSNWVAASGGPAAPLDLSIAPFRLLAIVNRVDLRDRTFPIDDAGECRFVFGVVDNTGPCTALDFTVILEYGVPKTGCTGAKGWAGQWAALNSLPFGATFNTALQAITDQVTAAGADPAKPNQSAINQIRSNEILIAPWDLREFVLNAAGFLVENTVAQTPQTIHNKTPLVTTYCNDPTYIPAILNDEHTVPMIYGGVPFLGAESETTGTTFWDGAPLASITTTGVRRHFSLNTCNGCHGAETSTAFTHISKRSAGVPSTLSGFLTGISVPDPAGIEPPAIYNDILRRTQDLDGLVNKPCLCFALTRPLKMSH